VTQEAEFRIAGPCRVESICLRSVDEDLTLTMRLIPIATRDGVDREREVEFFGVTGLQFIGGTTDLNQIVLLLGEDISSRGLENIMFVVKDYEEEFVRFYCREMRAEGVSLK
jgi:hypothetical protein